MCYKRSLSFSPKTYNKSVPVNPFPFFILQNEYNQNIKVKKRKKERKKERKKQTKKQKMMKGVVGTNALL